MEEEEEIEDSAGEVLVDEEEETEVEFTEVEEFEGDENVVDFREGLVEDEFIDVDNALLCVGKFNGNAVAAADEIFGYEEEREDRINVDFFVHSLSQ